MNVIRLPFRWERIQPALNGALDRAEVASIRQVGEWASQLGMCVILDVHNYGGYRGATIGSAGAPMSSFSDLWVRIHAEFPNPEVYAYGLMNEPFSIAVKAWTSVAQSAVLALRSAQSTNLILVGTARWSGAHEFLKELDGTSADKEFIAFNDPMNRLAIELHQYADSDFSGRGRDCMEPAAFRQILERVTEWSRKSGHKVFLGEFGVTGDARCLATLNEALGSMRDSSVWKGWTYWSAGRWWGDYAYSVQPKNGVDAPQMEVLRRFTRRPLPPSKLEVDSR
jgi:endoglucanase